MRTVLLAMGLAAGLSAQQPPIENARLEVKAFSGSLATQLGGLGAGPFWAAYSEPTIAGRHSDMCDMGSGVLRLEGQTAMLVLVRIEGGQVSRLRITSPDCRIDAGGLSFYWLTNVPAAESVAWLKQRVTATNPDPALMAIALHAGPAAEQVLDQFTMANEPERVREKAAFWLGNLRGAHGMETLKRMLATDPSEKVREQAIFALTLSKEAGAMGVVVEAARNDKDTRIRSRALFWIAQKAASKVAVDTIANAISNDADYSVKDQAVFALARIPDGAGVPLLIGVAKNNPDPAIRKKAMFWLGQSKDPNAVEFFAQVLAGR